MAASRNELMKPTRFDVDPSSPKAAKQFKHWLREFKDFAQKCDQIARAQDADVPDKLRMFFAFISADVYEMIEDCADYETALTKLKRVYVKSPNVIFARHALATRKQNPEESLQTFLNELLVLSKSCNFYDVTAEVTEMNLFVMLLSTV